MIKNATIVEQTSKKGNTYHILRVTFSNDYSADFYLTPEQVFILSNVRC